jgi:DNA mismatch repair protein MutS
MHAVQEGAANRSYGLQVASLAGVPKNVIQRARHKLHELEQGASGKAMQTATVSASPVVSVPVDEHEVIGALQDLDPDALTPRQALDALYRLKQLL